MENQTNKYNELFAALAKAQAEFDIVGKNRSSHYGGYADLEELIAATRPALTKYGLSISRRIDIVDGKQIYIGTMGHSSGQFIESKMLIVPEKATMQSLGGCLTYLARYTYRELCGVAISEDPEDNDAGNWSSESQRSKSDSNYSAPISKVVVKSPEPTPKISIPITDEQHEMLQEEVEGYPEIAKMILSTLKISSLKEMPKDLFSSSIKKIREIK
jgi:hypothetical protein